MSAQPIDVARESVDAFNTGDWDRLRAISHPDSVEEEYSTGRHLEGIDQQLDAAKGWKRAFPDGTGTVTAAYADGPVAILEIRWEGTNTGPMTTPTGEEVPPTARHVSVSASEIIQVEDGRIRSTHHYFDLMTLLDQLGMGTGGKAAVAG
jgi:steroid delta-isomerase-like uncharacterized protein